MCSLVRTSSPAARSQFAKSLSLRRVSRTCSCAISTPCAMEDASRNSMCKCTKHSARAPSTGTMHRTGHRALCTRHQVSRLLPPAHLDTDGCADESKLFADPIDEKPLVGKVEGCGHVRKEHE